MRRRSNGQSLVEMAFVAPILIVVLFGIIDMSWLIFAYSTISQGARAGAEEAAEVPPFPSWLEYANNNPGGGFTNITMDGCVNKIVEAVRQDSVLFRGGEGGLNGGLNIGGPEAGGLEFIDITYPNGPDSRNLVDRGPVEVKVSYPVRPLTPLFNLLRIGTENGGDRTLMMTITVRRSIENLGVNPGSPIGTACASDMANWRLINGVAP